MSTFHQKLAQVVQKDPRYPYEAYEFIFQALHHTQQRLGRLPPEETALTPADSQFHVSARELLEGICALAVREFGGLATTVFRQWGIHRTDDFGAIVFNLVAHDLLSKTADDSLADFHELFELDKALNEGFRIELEEL